jgi:hypothetical protein
MLPKNTTTIDIHLSGMQTNILQGRIHVISKQKNRWVVPPVFTAILNYFIQSTQFAGASVKFNSVYHKAVFLHMNFKAAAFTEKLLPADNTHLRVAEWTQHIIPPSY